MLTELGRYIKTLRVNKEDITQEALAKDLGYSHSQLSNIMNGKTAPDISFLVKCQKYFDLDKDATVELFSKAFSSDEILTIDTSYFSEERKKMLINAIVVLLLFKRITDTADAQYVQIKSHFESMIKTLNERNEIQNLDTLKKIERSPLLNKNKRQDMAEINDLIIP